MTSKNTRIAAALLTASLLAGCDNAGSTFAAIVATIDIFKAPPQELHLVRSITTHVDSHNKWDSPESSFQEKDVVYFYTVMTWDNIQKSAGIHTVLWKWYSGDRLIASYGRAMAFTGAPYHVYGYMPGMDLGPGHHKAEIYIDDKPFDSVEFDVDSNGPAT